VCLRQDLDFRFRWSGCRLDVWLFLSFFLLFFAKVLTAGSRGAVLRRRPLSSALDPSYGQPLTPATQLPSWSCKNLQVVPHSPADSSNQSLELKKSGRALKSSSLVSPPSPRTTNHPPNHPLHTPVLERGEKPIPTAQQIPPNQRSPSIAKPSLCSPIRSANSVESQSRNLIRGAYQLYPRRSRGAWIVAAAAEPRAQSSRQSRESSTARALPTDQLAQPSLALRQSGASTCARGAAQPCNCKTGMIFCFSSFFLAFCGVPACCVSLSSHFRPHCTWYRVPPSGPLSTLSRRAALPFSLALSLRSASQSALFPSPRHQLHVVDIRAAPLHFKRDKSAHAAVCHSVPSLP